MPGARKTYRQPVWSLTLSMLVLGWRGAPDAQAQTRGEQPRDPAAARALFLEGRAAAGANDYETACPKFVESYRLDPAVGTLLNIATCEEHYGRIASAWKQFRTALEQLPAGDSRRPRVERLIRELQFRLPYLEIRLGASAPRGTAVTRDGVPVAGQSLGSPTPVDPGKHSVIVATPGRDATLCEVELEERQQQVLVIEAGPRCEGGDAAWGARLPPSGMKPTRVEPSQDGGLPAAGRSKTLAYTLGGFGAAGIALGVVSRVLAFGQSSTIDENCDAKRSCNQTGMDAVSTAETLELVSTVSLVAGATALGIGLYLGFSAESEAAPRRAYLVPAVTPSGGGLTLGRSF